MVSFPCAFDKVDTKLIGVVTCNYSFLARANSRNATGHGWTRPRRSPLQAILRLHGRLNAHLHRRLRHLLLLHDNEGNFQWKMIFRILFLWWACCSWCSRRNRKRTPGIRCTRLAKRTNSSTRTFLKPTGIISTGPTRIPAKLVSGWASVV